MATGSKTRTRRQKINRHALQALRNRAGLTQQQLGECIGRHHTNIAHLESGRRLTLPLDVLGKLAEALEVPVEALYAAEQK